MLTGRATGPGAAPPNTDRVLGWSVHILLHVHYSPICSVYTNDFFLIMLGTVLRGRYVSMHVDYKYHLMYDVGKNEK